MYKIPLSLGGLIVIAGVVSAFFSLTPQKFIKLASLRTDADVSIHASLSTNKVVDPKKIVSAIPYIRGRFIDVLPKRRYERSIINGKGDCSNLAHGLAYSLVESNIDFSIVHLLKMPGFIDGEGHVALEAAMVIDGVRRSAVLDLLEGGILTDGSKIISSKDLLSGEYEQIRVIPYHETRDEKSRYYQSEQLKNTVLGFTPDEEIQQYFSFIETIYLDLGNKGIERYVFDGMALLIGLYPKIHVSETDANKIKEEFGTAQILSTILLWTIRLVVLSFFLYVISGLIVRLVRISRTKPR